MDDQEDADLSRLVEGLLLDVFLADEVARTSAFAFGLVYGSIKLSYLRTKAKSHKKADAKESSRSSPSFN
ncbi:hypothetical protein C4D60_Mb11t00550 [Musa balbisiana]|uniref:Uncharacterized protein n=1 Tax=Musa balbisiana TaxID=52838 RepID=A0A4S8J267_MUSBA|nr:hypothetical protein C4D60_Mb11t00550 [Musa balbisiana]